MLLALIVGACGQTPAARHRAITDEVLARTGAPDFVDASTAERPALRHAPSGLVCVMPRDGAFDLGVFPASAANPGAQCTTVVDGAASTFVVVNFRQGMTLDQAFADALATTVGQAERRQWPGRASAADRSSPEGLPHYRIARFETEIDGAPTYLRVAVSEARGWYLQQIVTAPLTQADTAEAAAGESWRAALREFGAE